MGSEHFEGTLTRSGRVRKANQRVITVRDVINEFKRLSTLVARGIISEEAVIFIFLQLGRASVVVFKDPLNEGVIRDFNCVLDTTLVEFLPSEHDFVAAFRRGYLVEQKSRRMLGRSPKYNPTLRVSSRVRRSVLYPQEPILMAGSG